MLYLSPHCWGRIGKGVKDKIFCILEVENEVFCLQWVLHSERKRQVLCSGRNLRTQLCAAQEKKIELNGKSFAPQAISGKRYYEALIGHPIDGFICRDIIRAVGGIKMENRAVVIGQQRAA